MFRLALPERLPFSLLLPGEPPRVETLRVREQVGVVVHGPDRDLRACAEKEVVLKLFF